MNLMASKEVVIADAWQPAVMAIKAQGVDCKYAVPVEGYRAWSIGISVIKDTPNYEAALAYANYWLSGPPAITVSEQGYYSPVTTIQDAMPEDQYNPGMRASRGSAPRTAASRRATSETAGHSPSAARPLASGTSGRTTTTT